VPNPDDSACPTTIGALRDVSDPDHPAEGSEVTVAGVVTGVNTGAGYFIQSTTESDGYDGVYIYDSGDASVSVGETVTVSGTYTEYYGLTEVAYAITTVTGLATVPAPVAITDPCAIGTGGADAERFESMLVTVNGVTITSANPDGAGDYMEFEVAGCLRVDDDLYSGSSATRTVGTAFTSITGVLSYTFSNNKLLPRSAADMVFE
jgi:predicted extracellular nuclease